MNGISVSGPPKIGERPYPRQFHPVEFTPVFEYFSSKPVSGFTSNTIQATNLTSIIPPIKHTQLVPPNSQISHTQVPHPVTPQVQLSSHTYTYYRIPYNTYTTIHKYHAHIPPDFHHYPPRPRDIYLNLLIIQPKPPPQTTHSTNPKHSIYILNPRI